jgi:hypothetical protein
MRGNQGRHNDAVCKHLFVRRWRRTHCSRPDAAVAALTKPVGGDSGLQPRSRVSTRYVAASRRQRAPKAAPIRRALVSWQHMMGATPAPRATTEKASTHNDRSKSMNSNAPLASALSAMTAGALLTALASCGSSASNQSSGAGNGGNGGTNSGGSNGGIGGPASAGLGGGASSAGNDAAAPEACRPVGGTRACCGGTQSCMGNEFPIWGPCLDNMGGPAVCLFDGGPPACGNISEGPHMACGV